MTGPMTMDCSRREWLSWLGAASLAQMPLAQAMAWEKGKAFSALYDIKRLGQVSFLHMTDCHAQLLPQYFREPSINIGVGESANRLPHLVGEPLLAQLGVKRGSPEAHAFSHLDFVDAAKRYGATGGFAHLRTLIQHLKASRPGALLLDGGDTWQGSATSLWTQGQDMAQACRLMGVDVMTGHWEFTLGAQRVEELLNTTLSGQVQFVAHNVKTRDFEDPVFKPYVLREQNGVLCAVIGQAFPYTPIAHPKYLVPDWTFGIQEKALQETIDEVEGLGAQVVILLSHNGLDVDLKLASRVRGLHAILGGHTHDALPKPIWVANRGGQTLVTNAGSNGKFLGLLDLDVSPSGVKAMSYRLLPVFSNLIPADPSMQALIEQLREPFAKDLNATFGVSEGLLYRRGNFNGTADQLILNALMQELDAPIALSPGFRWGSTLLPGQTITREWLMGQMATTYSNHTLSYLKGSEIHAVLEDVCDNLFHPDPYYQQGGDMVRVGGMSYTCTPNAKRGQRIQDLRWKGRLLDPSKVYKVAGWASVNEDQATQGTRPVWSLVEKYLGGARGDQAQSSLSEPLSNTNTASRSSVLPQWSQDKRLVNQDMNQEMGNRPNNHLKTPVPQVPQLRGLGRNQGWVL